MKDAYKLDDDYSEEKERRISYMRNELTRQSRERAKNQQNLSIIKKFLEEKNDESSNKVDPPDFKKVFFASDGTPMNMVTNFVLA